MVCISQIRWLYRAVRAATLFTATLVPMSTSGSVGPAPAVAIREVYDQAFARWSPDQAAEVLALRRAIRTAERRVRNSRAVDPRMSDILSADHDHARRAFSLMKMVKADQYRNARAITAAKYRMNVLLTKYLDQNRAHVDRIVTDAATRGFTVEVDRRGWDLKNVSVRDRSGRSIDFWTAHE